MTPEIGFVVFLALLVGPTALWLAYRGTVSRSDRVPGGLVADGAAVQPVQLLADGHWICPTCRSVNRAGAKRCYSCRAVRDDVAAPDADLAAEPTLARPIPIAPETPAASPIAVAVVPTPAVAIPIEAGAVASGVAREPIDPPNVRTRPVAPKVGPSAVVAGAAAVSAAATRPIAVAAEPAAPAVCPYIGLRDDPSTRLGFPDPRNVCHAAASRRARPWRGGRNDAIDPGHQATHCLTATHRRCARFPIAEEAAPDRGG